MAEELLGLAGRIRVTSDGVETAEAGREFQSDNCWRSNC